jgi:hypothetical protein
VTQRMKEILVADPPLTLHEIVMHDGDMCRRPPKTDAA